jgi:hypothetical protein
MSHEVLLKAGGVQVAQWSKDSTFDSSFHAHGGVEVKHSEKREAGPGADDHGCGEYNTISVKDHAGNEFTLFIDTDSLVELIEKGAEALTGCKGVGCKF